MRNRTGEQLTQAQATLKQIRLMLESRTILQVAGEDRQRRLKSSLATVERELASIQNEAEIRNDPLLRVARGEPLTDELRQQLDWQETPSE